MGEAADALIALSLALDGSSCTAIISALQDILAGASGHRVRAVGNAVGRLPVTLPALPVSLAEAPDPSPLPLSDLIRAFSAPVAGEAAWQGRSLVFPLENGRLGVTKFANSEENVTELAREHFFQAQMPGLHFLDRGDWQIPVPATVEKRLLFRITDPLPAGAPSGLYQGICIAYTACPEYFEYPNEGLTDWEAVEQVFFGTARTLGKLTAAGLFHTALIPLFHNRAQQHRRQDNGRYLWEHGGRLDQWLDSCRFPNFSLSGLRDFEHLEPAASSKTLRHTIGEHLLSFILVMGSCFRSRAPERRGRDSSGRPADTRDLFNAGRFTALITGVCRRYFAAFTDALLPRAFEDRIPVLVDDLIRTMGIDRDMEETLRIQDQEQMDQAAYEAFLAARGIAPAPPRAQDDIVMSTGPHLGGFNQTISVPGLVDFLYNFSSLCVSYCFEKENRLKAPAN